MPVVIKIALRNLLLHKAKTIIVGVLITLGISLTLVGNTILSAGVNNLRKSFTENFTGDVLITTKKDYASVFGANQEDMNKPPEVPILKDYSKILPLVSQMPEVETFTSQLSVYALLNLEDKGFDFSLLFGIDSDTYTKMFPQVQVLQGTMVNSQTEGIMIHEKRLEKLKKDFDLDLKIGDTIQLNNFGQGGIKIREVPVVGVYKFRAGNDRIFLPMITDPRTARYLSGKNSAEDEKVEVSGEATSLLGASGDDLFNSDMVTQSTSSQKTQESLENLLGPKTQKVQLADAGKGTWNFIILRLKPGQDVNAFMTKLNQTFQDQKLEAWAQGWKESSAPDSLLFDVVTAFFSIAMFILAVVTVLIIMNTLTVSIMERTSEIGMMRALGGQKGFIRLLFVSETLILTLASGIFGIIVGFLLTWILSFFQIPMTTDFLKMIAGGEALQVQLDFSQIQSAFGFIFFVGLFSWVLPVLTAQKVSPLKAITTE